MANYFEGISIEDLAGFDPNDDQSTITVDTFEVDTDNKDKTVVKDTKTGEEVKDDVNISFDIDEIANITLTAEELADKDKQKPASEDKSSSVITNNLLSTLAQNLHKAGILELTDEELTAIESEDKLYEAIQKQIKSNEYKELTDDQKLYLKAIENGIPEEDFAINRKNSAYFKNIDDTELSNDPQMQANLIYQSFLIRGFSKEEASKYAVSTVKNEEDAFETALTAKEAIIKYNDDVLSKEIKAKEDLKVSKAVEERKKITDLKSTIDKSSEIIPGININQTTKDKVFTSITKQVSVDDAGVPMNDVLDKYFKDSEYKMKVHAMHVLTKGFTDFSKLKAETKTTIVKSLKEEFNNTSNRSGAFGNSGGMTSQKIASMIPDFK